MGRLLHYLRSVLTHNTAQLLGQTTGNGHGRGLPSCSPWGRGGVVQGFPRWASRPPPSLHGGSGRAGGAGRRVLFARGTSRSQFGTSMTFRGEDCPILNAARPRKGPNGTSLPHAWFWVSWARKKVYLCRVLLLISASRRPTLSASSPPQSGRQSISLSALKLERRSCCSSATLRSQSLGTSQPPCHLCTPHPSRLGSRRYGRTSGRIGRLTGLQPSRHSVECCSGE